MIDNLRCANLSRLLPALRFVAFTITLLFCSLNTVFCLQKINIISDPKQLLSQGYYIVHPSITQFLKNKKRKKNTWHNPLHAFRKILPSIPPPSNVSRHFFPFLQRNEQKYLKCPFAAYRKTPIYFVCVKAMLNLWKDLHFCRAHFPSHGLLVF